MMLMMVMVEISILIGACDVDSDATLFIESYYVDVNSRKQKYQMYWQTFFSFFSIRNSKRTEMEHQEKDNVTVDAAE